MLTFAAFTPHTPLLIPNIGKENLKKIKKTVNAIEKLEQKLITAKPDTIIVISGHHSFLTDHFIINLNPQYKGDFQEFSDLSTELLLKADIHFINRIRDHTEDRLPLTLKSEENLEYGTLAPLFYLLRQLPESKVVPISYTTLDLQTHFELGRQLKEVIFSSDKRVAVVAAGDLSHTLSEKAPGGYSKKAREYDQSLIAMLREKNIKDILNIKEELLREVSECSLRSIVILLGIINKINYSPKILSYEHPFGVGYLTVNFNV